MTTAPWHRIERKLQRVKRLAMIEGMVWGAIVTALFCAAYLAVTTP